MALVRILLADETKFWRDLVLSVLRQDPSFEVIGEVSDGLRAVQLAERLQPAVVFLDVHLPKLPGIRAAGWIRMLAPKTKIVFLAERLEADVVEAALKLGPGGCILKSEAAQDLIPAIHAVGRGETFFGHRLAARRPSGSQVLPRTANEQAKARVPEQELLRRDAGMERAC